MRFARRCHFPALILSCIWSGETQGRARFSQPCSWKEVRTSAERMLWPCGGVLRIIFRMVLLMKVGMDLMYA